MTHGTHLHKKSFGNALEKRDPYPYPAPVAEPGLLGDLVSGVGTIANDVVDGVTGLVTTVLSDVNALVAPLRATSSVAPGPIATSSSGQATRTTSSTNTVSTPVSGGNTSGTNSGSNGNGSNGSGSNGTGSNSNNSPAAPPESVPGPSGTAVVAGGNTSPDNDSDISGTFSEAEGVSLASEGTTGLQSTASNPQPTPPASVSRSDVVNLAVGSESRQSSPGVTAVPVINAVGSVNSDDPLSGSLSSGARGTTTTRGTLHSPSSTGSPDPGDNGDLHGHGASSDTNHGLHPGIIAAIVIGSALALFVLIVFIARRWHRKRRERRLENWMSRPGPFAFLGAASVNVDKVKSEKSESAGSGSGTRSARSSFGTTFDHGLRPFTPDPFTQMSTSSFTELYSVSSASMNFRSPSPAPLTATAPVQRPENAVNRQSLISLESSSSYGTGGLVGHTNGNTSTEALPGDRDDSSDGHSQYLFVPVRQPNAPRTSPISVRPWSPSERWEFPKPPGGESGSSIFYQPPVSEAAQADRVPASHLPPLTPTVPHDTTDPFADPSQPSAGVKRVSATSATNGEAVTVKTSASGTDGSVGSVEYIRRPFDPTLADEIAVNRGDTIRILQPFDDGWVQVEKLSSSTQSNDPSDSNPTNERGLIPMDCLREAGEPLPSFLASRRVSSYYGSGIAI